MTIKIIEEYNLKVGNLSYINKFDVYEILYKFHMKVGKSKCLF